MNLASPPLGLVKEFWGLAQKPFGEIYYLKDNVDLLQNATNELKARNKDVKTKVEREEKEKGAQCTKQVESWLEEVQEFLGGEDQVLQKVGEHDRMKCLGRYLPQNCWLSYKLGKRVNQMLNKARELKDKGEFSIVTMPSGPAVGLDKPMHKTIGLDNSLNEVLKWLVDDKQVRMIGLYGIGGVGKTTLMIRINNELSQPKYGFDFIIWVAASSQVSRHSIQDEDSIQDAMKKMLHIQDEYSIQDAIRKRLHIQDESWNKWCRDERVHHLHQIFIKKKVVLLIDGVWQSLNLSNIGVPPLGLEYESKVVFTTRKKDICDHMGADKTLEVQCLTPEEALKLFEKNVGRSLVGCHQEIRDLTKPIAEECKGLPLALITVGRAMAGKDNPRLWRHTLTMLRSNPHNLPGMVENVYCVLGLSYINLMDPIYQACFLYCCLFPENYPIITDKLIELWIGEDLLGGTNDVYSLRDQGECVLGILKTACLLKSETDLNGEYVKMHSVIRKMATWIARDYGKRENKLLVIEKEEDMSAEMISKLGGAEKVSLWGKRIKNINQKTPMCSQLKTLFVRETEVMIIPIGFFDSPRLSVLDLSHNKNILSFPKEICNLINLQYLNLSATGIHELPMEIKNLTHLRCLLLDNTIVPFIIPTGAIANLPLDVFSQWSLSSRQSGQENEEEIIEELGHMEHLNDLSIEVFKSGSALNIFKSLNIQRSIRILGITNCADLTVIPISAMLKEMEITQGIGQASNCFCFPRLIEVCVRRCGLSDLSWLVHAPILRILTVKDCDSMEKIISDGITPEELAASRLFSYLESLEINCLPKLTSICDQVLFFPQGVSFHMLPSLVEVCVKKCGLSDLSWLLHAPKLRKLTVEGCDSIEKIIGDGIVREEVVASGLFSCLKSLDISYLPNLTSICDQILCFPQGVSFRIRRCPNLRKLPFDSNSLKGSFSIIAEADWWPKFEWDDDAQVAFALESSLIERVEKLKFGEAVRKMKNQPPYSARIRFRPSGPS